MRELTPRQKQILEMIQEFIGETGMPPTRAEIAAELGFKSANAAEEHLRALQRKGVRWLFGVTADRLERDGERLRITLADGTAFETDVVLSAAGLVANTQLADAICRSLKKPLSQLVVSRFSNDNLFVLLAAQYKHGQSLQCKSQDTGLLDTQL